MGRNAESLLAKHGATPLQCIWAIYKLKRFKLPPHFEMYYPTLVEHMKTLKFTSSTISQLRKLIGNATTEVECEIILSEFCSLGEPLLPGAFSKFLQLSVLNKVPAAKKSTTAIFTVMIKSFIRLSYQFRELFECYLYYPEDPPEYISELPQLITLFSKFRNKLFLRFLTVLKPILNIITCHFCDIFNDFCSEPFRESILFVIINVIPTAQHELEIQPQLNSFCLDFIMDIIKKVIEIPCSPSLNQRLLRFLRDICSTFPTIKAKINLEQMQTLTTTTLNLLGQIGDYPEVPADDVYKVGLSLLALYSYTIKSNTKVEVVQVSNLIHFVRWIIKNSPTTIEQEEESKNEETLDITELPEIDLVTYFQRVRVLVVGNDNIVTNPRMIEICHRLVECIRYLLDSEKVQFINQILEAINSREFSNDTQLRRPYISFVITLISMLDSSDLSTAISANCVSLFSDNIFVTDPSRPSDPQFQEAILAITYGIFKDAPASRNEILMAINAFFKANPEYGWHYFSPLLNLLLLNNHATDFCHTFFIQSIFETLCESSFKKLAIFDFLQHTIVQSSFDAFHYPKVATFVMSVVQSDDTFRSSLLKLFTFSLQNDTAAEVLITTIRNTLNVFKRNSKSFVIPLFKSFVDGIRSWNLSRFRSNIEFLFKSPLLIELSICPFSTLTFESILQTIDLFTEMCNFSFDFLFYIGSSDEIRGTFVNARKMIQDRGDITDTVLRFALVRPNSSLFLNPYALDILFKWNYQTEYEYNSLVKLIGYLQNPTNTSRVNLTDVLFKRVTEINDLTDLYYELLCLCLTAHFDETIMTRIIHEIEQPNAFKPERYIHMLNILFQQSPKLMPSSFVTLIKPNCVIESRTFQLDGGFTLSMMIRVNEDVLESQTKFLTLQNNSNPILEVFISKEGLSLIKGQLMLPFEIQSRVWHAIQINATSNQFSLHLDTEDELSFTYPIEMPGLFTLTVGSEDFEGDIGPFQFYKDPTLTQHALAKQKVDDKLILEFDPMSFQNFKYTGLEAVPCSSINKYIHDTQKGDLPAQILRLVLGTKEKPINVRFFVNSITDTLQYAKNSLLLWSEPVHHYLLEEGIKRLSLSLIASDDCELPSNVYSLMVDILVASPSQELRYKILNCLYLEPSLLPKLPPPIFENLLESFESHTDLFCELFTNYPNSNEAYCQVTQSLGGDSALENAFWGRVLSLIFRSCNSIDFYELMFTTLPHFINRPFAHYLLDVCISVIQAENKYAFGALTRKHIFLPFVNCYIDAESSATRVQLLRIIALLAGRKSPFTLSASLFLINLYSSYTNPPISLIEEVESVLYSKTDRLTIPDFITLLITLCRYTPLEYIVRVRERLFNFLSASDKARYYFIQVEFWYFWLFHLTEMSTTADTFLDTIIDPFQKMYALECLKPMSKTKLMAIDNFIRIRFDQEVQIRQRLYCFCLSGLNIHLEELKDNPGPILRSVMSFLFFKENVQNESIEQSPHFFGDFMQREKRKISSFCFEIHIENGEWRDLCVAECVKAIVERITSFEFLLEGVKTNSFEAIAYIANVVGRFDQTGFIELASAILTALNTQPLIDDENAFRSLSMLVDRFNSYLIPLPEYLAWKILDFEDPRDSPELRLFMFEDTIAQQMEQISKTASMSATCSLQNFVDKYLTYLHITDKSLLKTRIAHGEFISHEELHTSILRVLDG